MKQVSKFAMQVRKCEPVAIFLLMLPEDKQKSNKGAVYKFGLLEIKGHVLFRTRAIAENLWN